MSRFYPITVCLVNNNTLPIPNSPGKSSSRQSPIRETGIRKFRERVKEENSNKLIIFDGGRYAVFDAYEVLILCGKNVLKPRGVPEKVTKKDILLKYGAWLE